MVETLSDVPKEVAQPKEQPPDFSQEINALPGVGNPNLAKDDAYVSGLGFPKSSDLLPADQGAQPAAAENMNKNAGMSMTTDKNGRVLESSTTDGDTKETFAYRKNGQISRKTIENPGGKQITDFNEDGSTSTTGYDKSGKPMSLNHENLDGQKFNAKYNEQGNLNFEYSDRSQNIKGVMKDVRSFQGTWTHKEGIENVEGKFVSSKPFLFHINKRATGI